MKKKMKNEKKNTMLSRYMWSIVIQIFRIVLQSRGVVATVNLSKL